MEPRTHLKVENGTYYNTVYIPISLTFISSKACNAFLSLYTMWRKYPLTLSMILSFHNMILVVSERITSRFRNMLTSITCFKEYISIV